MNSQLLFNNILIDPGHVGKSFFDFRDFKIDEIQFHEGDFCSAWAEILQKALIVKSINVSLSREKGRPSFKMDSVDLQKRKTELMSDVGIEEALKKFRIPRIFFPLKSADELLEAAIQNEADLLNRAKLANDKNFDLCLSLHLNGDPSSLKTTKNGICGFTNHVSKEHFKFFENIIANISLETNLPIIRNDQMSEVSKGVFLDESLTLLKNIKIPILLIEGPFQNNPDELILLNHSLKSFEDNKAVTGRLGQLTNAIINTLSE